MHPISLSSDLAVHHDHSVFLIFNDFLSPQAQAKTRHKVMGVLDIYGFEIFEVRQMANPKQALLA